jgi:hypothetical protein
MGATRQLPPHLAAYTAAYTDSQALPAKLRQQAELYLNKKKDGYNA